MHVYLSIQKEKRQTRLHIWYKDFGNFLSLCYKRFVPFFVLCAIGEIYFTFLFRKKRYTAKGCEKIWNITHIKNKLWFYFTANRGGHKKYKLSLVHFWQHFTWRVCLKIVYRTFWISRLYREHFPNIKKIFNNV